jgi:hypothetical protein
MKKILLAFIICTSFLTLIGMKSYAEDELPKITVSYENN